MLLWTGWCSSGDLLGQKATGLFPGSCSYSLAISVFALSARGFWVCVVCHTVATPWTFCAEAYRDWAVCSPSRHLPRNQYHNWKELAIIPATYFSAIAGSFYVQFSVSGSLTPSRKICPKRCGWPACQVTHLLLMINCPNRCRHLPARQNLAGSATLELFQNPANAYLISFQRTFCCDTATLPIVSTPIRSSSLLICSRSAQFTMRFTPNSIRLKFISRLFWRDR